MSILSKVLKGQESVTDGFKEGFDWLGRQFDRLKASSPAIAAAVNALEANAQKVEVAAADWADTAIAPALGDFGDELADLLAKYAPKLVGSAMGAAITPAGVMVIQALEQVGVAIVHHELAQFVASQAPGVFVAQSPATAGLTPPPAGSPA